MINTFIIFNAFCSEDHLLLIFADVSVQLVYLYFPLNTEARKKCCSMRRGLFWGQAVIKLRVGQTKERDFRYGPPLRLLKLITYCVSHFQRLTEIWGQYIC